MRATHISAWLTDTWPTLIEAMRNVHQLARKAEWCGHGLATEGTYICGFIVHSDTWLILFYCDDLSPT
jgi:hypothetical protein